MGKTNFSGDFKRDAVAQITEHGYPVSLTGKSDREYSEWV
jgi:transposase-like protein